MEEPLAETYLGPATRDGWIRTKHGKKRLASKHSESSSLSSTSTTRSRSSNGVANTSATPHKGKAINTKKIQVTFKPPPIISFQNSHKKPTHTSNNPPSLYSPNAGRKSAPATSQALATPRSSPPPLSPKPSERLSIISFTSGSTKIGEIPERKWTTRDYRFATDAGVDGPDYQSFMRPVFPLYPYVEPEKQRSRFMRLFGKS